MRHSNFSEIDVAKAMAIVSIFETGMPQGNYAAIAVLDDGAGISYGIKQFTHASGSLVAVISRYLDELGGSVGAATLRARLPLLQRTTRAAIETLAGDMAFRNALRGAAATVEMRRAQNEIAFERYLKPALVECVQRGFTVPLSLAVVYDSFVHGSWPMISRRIDGRSLDEKAWITAYVRERDRWLRSIARLRKTAYRTSFFLDQIKTGRWTLELPLTVNGRRLAAGDLANNFFPASQPRQSSERSSTDERHLQPHTQLQAGRHAAAPANAATPAVGTGVSPLRRRPAIQINALDALEARVNAIAAHVDQADRVLQTAQTRTDKAKSMWTTIAGTVWQMCWAVAGIAADVPRVVWLVTALLAGALMLLYLYRQIDLGRRRENAAK